MFIKLGNLRDWLHLNAEEFHLFPASKSNRVSLEVSSATNAGLYYYPVEDGKPDTSSPPVFLALSKGYQRVQFVVGIDIAFVSDAPVSIKTNAGIEKHKYQATESFTEITERRSMSADALAIHQQSKLRELQHQNEMRKLMENMHGISKQISSLNKSKSATDDDTKTTEQKSAVDVESSSQTTTTTAEVVEDKKNE